MLHHRTYSRDAVEKPIKSVINKMLISPNSNWSTNSKLQCPGSPPPNTNTITASIPTISQARRAFFTWRASATPKPCGIRIVALQKLQKHVTLPIMSEPTYLSRRQNKRWISSFGAHPLQTPQNFSNSIEFSNYVGIFLRVSRKSAILQHWNLLLQSQMISYCECAAGCQCYLFLVDLLDICTSTRIPAAVLNQI